MTFFAIPFPAIDPVLIEIGPFAIRWYALAYIAGIFLGWWYAKRLVADRRLWGPAGAPMKPRRHRRLRRLGGARHRPRRPHRLRAVLRPAALPRATRPRSSPSGTAACRSTAASSARSWRWRSSPARRSIPVWSLIDVIAAVGDLRPLPRPPRQLHQRRAVRPRRPTCPGRWSFPNGGDRAAPSEPALRGGARRARAVPRSSASSPTAITSSPRPASSPAASPPATAWRAPSSNSSASRTSRSATSPAG